MIDKNTLLKHPDTQHFGENQRLTCEEKGKKLEFQTGNAEWIKIPSDKIFQQHKTGNQCKRCDFIILSTTKTIQMYVELKGKNFEMAYDQILATHKLFQENQAQHYAIIIGSRIPAANTEMQKIKNDWKKKGNAELFSKSKKLILKYKNNKIEK